MFTGMRSCSCRRGPSDSSRPLLLNKTNYVSEIHRICLYSSLLSGENVCTADDTVLLSPSSPLPEAVTAGLQRNAKTKTKTNIKPSVASVSHAGVWRPFLPPVFSIHARSSCFYCFVSRSLDRRLFLPTFKFFSRHPSHLDEIRCVRSPTNQGRANLPSPLTPAAYDLNIHPREC